MKKKIVIANWKMNLGGQEAEILAKDIFKRINQSKKKMENLDIVLCPSFTNLETVSKFLAARPLFGRQARVSNLFLGAQDCFWENKGAFTGEISPANLKELGCRYVIIGHSERRKYLGETDEMVHKKVKTCLDNDLIPIICVGESFEERQKGTKDYVIINQVSTALEGLDLKAHHKLIIAYEPVWVIGSGQAVEPEEAEYTNQVIMQRLIDFYPLPIVRNCLQIIYGGSIDPTNIKDFVGKEIIDGVLVGGASLKVDEFTKMCEIIS